MVLIYPVVFVMCETVGLYSLWYCLYVLGARFLCRTFQTSFPHCIWWSYCWIRNRNQVNMNYCFQPLWVRVLSLAHNGCYLSEREVRIVPIWRDRSRVASQGRPNRIYGPGDLGEQCVSNTASVCIIYNYLVFVHIHCLLCLSVFSIYSFMLL